jgi:two-component system nitrate/nitrite response regulator NarL
MSNTEKNPPAASRPIRLVLSDDHPLVLVGLEMMFDSPDFKIVATCEDGARTLVTVQDLKPDILLLDLRLPIVDGFGVLRGLRESRLPTRTIVFTGSARRNDAEEALKLGARGVLEKIEAPQRVLQCVRDVHAGKTWVYEPSSVPAAPPTARDETITREDLARVLTPRELDIVDMLSLAHPNKIIASRLGITEGTVKVHLHRIYDKLQVKGRMDLLLQLTRRPE